MSFLSQIFTKKEKSILSIDAFGQHIIKTIEPELPHYQYDIVNIDGNSTILIMNGDDERARIMLVNHYSAYIDQSSDHGREQVLSDLSQKLLSALTDFEQNTMNVDGKIMPVIKPYSWLQQYADAEGKSFTDCSMLWVPLAFEGTGDLGIVFAIDQGENMMFANEALFPNVDISELYQEAIENIQLYFIEQIKAETLQINEQAIGCFVSTDGNYESSLVLLIAPLIEHFMTIVGDPVFVLLARDTFIIADSDNKEQITALKEAAVQSFSEISYPLSSTLYTYKNRTIYIYED